MDFESHPSLNANRREAKASILVVRKIIVDTLWRLHAGSLSSEFSHFSFNHNLRVIIFRLSTPDLLCSGIIWTVEQLMPRQANHSQN